MAKILTDIINNKGVKESIELTDKQYIFCQEYIKDFNGTQAAIRAGYSENTAKEISSENLTKPNIFKVVEYLKTEAWRRNHATLDEIIDILSKMARVDISKAFDEDGKLLPLQEIPKDIMLSINGLETDNQLSSSGEIVLSKIHKLKLSDRLSAIEKLMKYRGGYKIDNSQKIPQVVVNFPK